jgi:hypothetical protein
MENNKMNIEKKSFWARLLKKLETLFTDPRIPTHPDFPQWTLHGDIIDKHWRHSLSHRGFERMGMY